MALLVVQTAVEEYGSTHDKDLVVLIHPPSPSKKTTTKWMVACILGLTATVMVSSATLLFVSRRDATIHTDEAFLLHRKDGTCVMQSGAWPIWYYIV